MTARFPGQTSITNQYCTGTQHHADGETQAQGGGGGGGTLIFSHIRRLGPFFWDRNSEFQYFLGFSEKWIFLGGMKILWIFFFFWGGGVITKLG